MARRKKGKKAKKNHGGEEVAEEDRLSDLPDCILLHILSFLPEIRFCVRTTLLSKRWKNLWASLPGLIFHRRESRNAQSFKKLVRNVLNRRENLPLKKLCFKYFEKDKSLIAAIIKYAMSHNVQHFSLYLKSASLTCLSSFFNISPSLKTLKLENFHNMHLLQDFTLPRLTTLYLSGCSFWGLDNGETISIDPFVGLFNLKRLDLIHCSVYKVTNFMISGPKLDSLGIAGHNGWNVEIFAPKLRWFTFMIKSFNLEKFPNLDLPLLEVAGIDVGLAEPLENEDFLKSLLHFIKGLYNAQALAVCSAFIEGLMESLDVLEDQSSPFVRLKMLRVLCPAHLMSSFNVPDNVIKYFGENIPVEKVKY